MTVIKLHGDYGSTGLRNTPEELGEYPPALNELLDCIFDEYGFLVVGWSAEYDTALRDAMTRAPSRRYPTFWTAYQGDLSEEARRLIALRDVTVIDTAGADEFISDLADEIKRLDDVAVRRNRPVYLRSYAFPPQQGVPQGWNSSPLLQLRAVGVVGPATVATSGLIRPPQRAAVLGALRMANATSGVRLLSSRPAASATGEPLTGREPPPITDWEPSPTALQTTEYASYRLGGDASAGVSALVMVRFPAFGMGGDQVVFTIDVGVSITKALRLGEVARLLRDGLVLVTGLLPGAVADIVPLDAETQLAEVHLLAATMSGNAESRPNDLLDRVDLTQLGTPTRTVGPSMGFSARIPGALSEREAAVLVVDAIEYMALASGYLDPTTGVYALRGEMGLPPAG